MPRRVLILGGTGMLGHKLLQRFRDRFDTWATVRHWAGGLDHIPWFDKDRVLPKVDAFELETVRTAIERLRPDVVINCIGIVKQLAAANDPITSLTVNALFPHHLAKLCQNIQARLIHISTDCVFSGQKGGYTEDDPTDAYDLYGRAKSLGEVTGAGCLTLRTSIIGRELNSQHGLVEWFLSQEHLTVKGFSGAIFSGLTTSALADVIGRIIDECPGLTGLYHVSTDPINKLELLKRLRDAYPLAIQIISDSQLQSDRSLNSQRFRSETGIAIPGWDDLIAELVADSTSYPRWRPQYQSTD